MQVWDHWSDTGQEDLARACSHRTAKRARPRHTRACRGYLAVSSTIVCEELGEIAASCASMTECFFRSSRSEQALAEHCHRPCSQIDHANHAEQTGHRPICRLDLCQGLLVRPASAGLPAVLPVRLQYPSDSERLGVQVSLLGVNGLVRHWRLARRHLTGRSLFWVSAKYMSLITVAGMCVCATSWWWSAPSGPNVASERTHPATFSKNRVLSPPIWAGARSQSRAVRRFSRFIDRDHRCSDDSLHGARLANRPLAPVAQDVRGFKANANSNALVDGKFGAPNETVLRTFSLKVCLWC